MSLARLFSVLVTVVFMTVLTVSASAGSITFTTILSGSNEVPPRNTTATGSATLIVDDVTGKAILSVNFSGLSAGLTGAHIHCCAAVGANGPVLQGFDSQLTAGSTSGSLSNYTLPLTFSAQNIADLKNGLMYVNVHTSAFPGGEIRGQLVAPVPEPGTLFLIGTGLFSVAGMMRRKRKE